MFNETAVFMNPLQLTESTYNPLWAADQPPIRWGLPLPGPHPPGYSSNRSSCVALDLSSSESVGWRLTDCSRPLSVLCETFACLPSSSSPSLLSSPPQIASAVRTTRGVSRGTRPTTTFPTARTVRTRTPWSSPGPPHRSVSARYTDARGHRGVIGKKIAETSIHDLWLHKRFKNTPSSLLLQSLQPRIFPKGQIDSLGGNKRNCN